MERAGSAPEGPGGVGLSTTSATCAAHVDMVCGVTNTRPEDCGSAPGSDSSRVVLGEDFSASKAKRWVTAMELTCMERDWSFQSPHCGVSRAWVTLGTRNQRLLSAASPQCHPDPDGHLPARRVQSEEGDLPTLPASTIWSHQRGMEQLGQGDAGTGSGAWVHAVLARGLAPASASRSHSHHENGLHSFH